MIRRQDLGPLGVNPPIAHPHFVDLIHQLADEIKAKTGVAEGRDPAFRSEDHLGVLDRVLKVIFAPHRVATIAQFYISTGWSAEDLVARQRATASAVKMASAIQMRVKVSICARRKGS